MIRVGKRIYNKCGSYTDPSYDGYIPIVCLTKSTKYGMLGPYCLKNDDGQIMENIYQFSKIYEKVPKVSSKESRFSSSIIWNHPAETHVIDHVPTSEYWNWREKGMNNPYPVRYPAGYNNRHECLGILKENNEDGTYDCLNYIEGRKQVYIPEYSKLVKTQPKFKELKDMLLQGKNLLIIEVDGPHQESLDYYKEKYNVTDDFIEDSTIIVNEANIGVMLNDEKHSFGHGYVLAMCLLDKEVEWNK